MIAGTAKIDITPDIPVKLYGYASRKTYSEGVHDPLSARVAVFEKEGRKIVLVSSDLGSYGSEVFAVIQKSILEKFNLKESELFPERIMYPVPIRFCYKLFIPVFKKWFQSRQ